MKTKSKKPEAAIQASILRYLKSAGLLHWRQNSGTLVMGKYRITLGMKGLPDIIVVIPPDGRFLGLEVKSETGKWRPAQKEFAAKLESSGGRYEIVRSLKDAKDVIAESLKSDWERAFGDLDL